MKSFSGNGWAGILRGLGAAPLALRVIRSVPRPAHRCVLRVVALLCVLLGLPSPRPGGRELRGTFFAAADLFVSHCYSPSSLRSACNPVSLPSWFLPSPVSLSAALHVFRRAPPLGRVVPPGLCWFTVGVACGGRSGARRVWAIGSRFFSRCQWLRHFPCSCGADASPASVLSAWCSE